MAFAMRITGALADWCAHEGAKVGQTGPEFVRSALRLTMQGRGIDYRKRPAGTPAPPATEPDVEADPVDETTAPADMELPGQARLYEEARDAIETFKAGQSKEREADPFDE